MSGTARFRLFLSAMLSSNAFPAVPDEELIGCASIPQPISRLQCFDGLTAANGLSPLPVTANVAGAGKWQLVESVNPLDDTKTVALALEATSGEGSYGDEVLLIARCQSNNVDVFVDWKSYLGDNSSPTVRIGSAPAERQQWNMSSDNTATFARSGRLFLESIENEDRLVMQLSPYNESPITAVFELTGLSSAVQPLWEACAPPPAPVVAPLVPPPADAPLSGEIVTVTPGSIMCATSSAYNRAIEIDRAATNADVRDYGDQCYVLGNDGREFEKVRVSAGATIVRRGGQQLYTANENVQ